MRNCRDSDEPIRRRIKLCRDKGTKPNEPNPASHKALSDKFFRAACCENERKLFEIKRLWQKLDFCSLAPRPAWGLDLARTFAGGNQLKAFRSMARLFGIAVL